MLDEHEPAGTTRRNVLGAVAAVPGTASVASATQQALDVDADNLVAGNRWFTVALDGVRTDEIDELALTVDGVAFAAVEMFDGASPVLAVDARNLAPSDRIRNQDAVTVEVWVEAGGQRYAGSDETRVVPD